MTNELPRNSLYAVCAHCGQTLPPVGLPDGVYLTRLEAVIYEAVQKSGKYGLHSDRLFFAMYGNELRGGPDSGKNSMCVLIKRLNNKLAPLGKRVRARRTGYGTPRNYIFEKFDKTA